MILLVSIACKCELKKGKLTFNTSCILHAIPYKQLWQPNNIQDIWKRNILDGVNDYTRKWIELLFYTTNVVECKIEKNCSYSGLTFDNRCSYKWNKINDVLIKHIVKVLILCCSVIYTNIYKKQPFCWQCYMILTYWVFITFLS